MVWTADWVEEQSTTLLTTHSCHHCVSKAGSQQDGVQRWAVSLGGRGAQAGDRLSGKSSAAHAAPSC
ncbi:Spectrin Beta Chain, Non-Erythrocytic 4 [Manis pentadactyla]|nr:Spectrin Beta Chain, Non-Erythrocytic 4 [Manis pentadactyla]